MPVPVYLFARVDSIQIKLQNNVAHVQMAVFNAHQPQFVLNVKKIHVY